MYMLEQSKRTCVLALMLIGFCVSVLQYEGCDQFVEVHAFSHKKNKGQKGNERKKKVRQQTMNAETECLAAELPRHLIYVKVS